MDSSPDQSATDSGGETPEIEYIKDEEKPHNERVDIDIGDVIRCYPEEIPRIISSYKDWARQWDQ